MTDAESNVVVLADYRNGNVHLNVTNVKAFLEVEREEIRKFNADVYALLRRKHKIKIAEDCRDMALEHEQSLLIVSDWLNDQLNQINGSEKEQYGMLLNECEKLIERNERTKKNIVDDLAACRHYENKRELIKILGFALITPVTMFNLVRALAPLREDLAWTAGIGGAALGSTVAFHAQAREMLTRGKRAVMNSPDQIKKLGKTTRTSFIWAAFSVSVMTKEVSEIKPSIRPQEIHRRMVYSANK